MVQTCLGGNGRHSFLEKKKDIERSNYQQTGRRKLAAGS